jgi:NAD+ synthase (glutamine-hydrolysing)
VLCPKIVNTMKIALAQMEVIPGGMDKNVRKMLDMINLAKEQAVGLLVFPELCVSGYILSDLWVNDSFCEALMNYNRVIREASKGIVVAYGNIYQDREINTRWNDSKYHPNKDGRTRKYNAVYVVQNGFPARRIKESMILPEGVHPKTLLPEYRIFDDERYFFSLQDIVKDAGVSLQEVAQPFILDVNGEKVVIGFEVCEDLWCNDYRLRGEPLNVTNILIQNGAEMIVNISASPWNYGKNAARDSRIAFLKEQAGNKFVPFLYVNNVGIQNNGKNFITFDGGTTVYNRDGRPVLMARKSYEEELIMFHDSIVDKAPLIREEEPKIKGKFEAIISGIKHMAMFKPANEPLRFVIGLSGGIDSAVVACLLTLACGKENVIAISMPSKHNATRTKYTTRHIVDKLGIDFYSVPIDPFVSPHNIFTQFDSKFTPSNEVKDLSDENIQAKIRGTSILSNFAGRYNRFFTCNGNKLEIALGYTTLYGDVNGALAPIGDLTKTEVYEMARFLNDEIFREPIIPSALLPDRLFSFDGQWVVPSPELKKDQIDPIRFGYHCALLEALTDYLRKSPEDILQWYLEGELESHLNISNDLIVRWGMDDPRLFVQDLEWFTSTIQKNIFKRIQAPPIIITSRSSYGYDIRESMLPFYTTPHYDRMKSEVLKMKKYLPQPSS